MSFNGMLGDGKKTKQWQGVEATLHHSAPYKRPPK
jgi:hypothetical protein